MMNERPNCVCENSRTECGTPLRTVSSGIVTCFSTSSGARPGKRAMTLTCVSETSGNASMGRLMKATMPPAMKITTSNAAKSGWCSAKWTRRRIMGFSVEIAGSVADLQSRARLFARYPLRCSPTRKSCAGYAFLSGRVGGLGQKLFEQQCAFHNDSLAWLEALRNNEPSDAFAADDHFLSRVTARSIFEHYVMLLSA